MNISKAFDTLGDYFLGVTFVIMFFITEILVVAPYVVVGRLLNYRAYRKGEYHDGFPSMAAHLIDNRKQYFAACKKKLKSLVRNTILFLYCLAEYPFTKK